MRDKILFEKKKLSKAGTSSYMIILPASVLKLWGYEEGKEIYVYIGKNSELILSPKPSEQ